MKKIRTAGAYIIKAAESRPGPSPGWTPSGRYQPSVVTDADRRVVRALLNLHQTARSAFREEQR